MSENLFTQNLVGKALAGQYKRAGREAVAMSLEVSAHVVLQDSRGKGIPYLFGTRTDPANAGATVLVRTGCFNPNTAQAIEYGLLEALRQCSQEFSLTMKTIWRIISA